MRLAYVSHSLPPAGRPEANRGGMQRVALELHDALLAHPEVALVPLVLRSAWGERHWRVPLFLADTLGQLAGLAARREIDAVLFSSMVTAALAIPVRRTLNRQAIRAAAIANGHDVMLRSAPYQWLVPRVFRALDLVLPISSATASACQARGLPPDRTHVALLGVDPGRFTPPTDRGAARRELVGALGDAGRPLPHDALLLCSVGRHVQRKGFRWFVEEVMPLLGGNVHYWLAGDGPESGRIRDTVQRRGLGERVRLLGGIPDAQLLQLYRGSDLFVMPNVPVSGDMEGFGLVMLEAGACGLPTIAARLEGILDAIAEGRNGTLVESGDAAAFADAILHYERNRTALAVASERAARYTAATFSWRAAADRYVNAIRELRPRG